MPLKAKLVVVGGEVKTAEIKLRLPSTIGRGRGTTIMLPHPLVSRQHCELYEADGKLMVRDLGSLNGTFVNNERITEAPLEAGELLTVGTVTFRAVYDVSSENGAPPAAKPAASAKTPDPLARTVRTEAQDPVDLDDLEELEEELSGDTAQDNGEMATFFTGPKSSSSEKTDRFSDSSDEIVASKGSQSPSAAQSQAKSQPPASATAIAPLKSDDETTYVAGVGDTESEDEDEDDLNDFLKNLG